jgi:hypothetical protein
MPLPRFPSDRWACIDYMMQVLRRHVLEQFFEGDGQGGQGRDEQLAVVQRDFDKRPLLQVGLRGKRLRDA